MSNKIHSTVLVFISLQFFVTEAEVFADASAKLEQAKSSIISLIKEGNYAQAKAKTQKLVADFSADAALPEALSSVAMQFELSDKYDDAKSVYQQMRKIRPDSIWLSKAKLGVARTEVLSLIMAKDSRAKGVFDKLLADFSGHPDLPETLYYVARRYEWADKYEDAKAVYYRQLTQGHYDSPYTAKAKLGAARADILFLILSGNYDQAKKVFDKAVVDFSGHPNWPDTLYWIAERYKWAGRYEDAKDFYQKIIQGYPNSPYADRAKLGIPRADVQFLIRSYDFINAKKALDKMVADFDGHPDLPETLYWCAEKYGLSDNYEEEKAVYQKIMQKYPDSSYTKKAELGFKRADILSLILSKNYDQAKDAYNKLLTEGLSGHPDFPSTLLSIARRNEWGQQFNEAKSIYQKVIQDYPDSSYAGKATLGLSRTEVASLIDSQDYNGADAAFDKLVTDFSNHPDLPRAILATGEMCYREGLSKESAGLEVQAKDRFEKAVQMWEKLINQFPDSYSVPEACCWAGDCYFEKLNKYEDAIRCFQKVVDNYPTYQHAWHAQFMIGRSFEVLKDAGVVDKSEADAKIKAAYEKVIRNYPDCSAAGYADNWLSSKVKVEKEK
jgi:TolA-binding protein